MADSILFNIENGLAIITLNRPAKLNSFNREMALLLQKKLALCNGDNVRAVYLTGNGNAFCAGQDLEEVLDKEGPGMQRILKEHFNPVVELMRNLPKPVVAAVNGVAAGAGANLALCADIVVASDKASFIQAFSKIGLIPDSGGTFMLPRLIGWQKASALMLLGDKVSAAEAVQMGMIYKMFAHDDFANQAMQLTKKLVAMPTTGLALTKKALNISFQNNLTGQLQLEDHLQQLAAATSDFTEGVNAFVEKRVPIFTGK